MALSHSVMKYKSHILFDLDGTISDPACGITKSFAYALESFDIYVEDLHTLNRIIGPPIRDSFRDLYGLSKESSEQAVEKYREYFGRIGIFENEIYPGIKSLLSNLKDKGKTLIIATSKPTVYAAKILEYFNIEDYFEFVSGSELDGSRSDKSEIIKYAMENIKNMCAENSIMIGDRFYDIEGAKSVGMDSIGVLYGYGNEDELRNAGANFIVGKVSDLHELLINNDK